MEEKQSERLLRFQRVSRDAFVDELRKRHRLRRAAMSPLRVLVSRTLAASSPYHGKRAIEPGVTLWDDICRVYDLPTTVARARSSVPPPPSPFIGSEASVSSPSSLFGS